MAEAFPHLASTGLPAYNEARHAEAAINALRAQDYSRIEIIARDDASTDETPAICRTHAAVDPRIRIDAGAETLNTTDSVRRPVTPAASDCFTSASEHDLWSPGLAAECVTLREPLPKACLAYGSAGWVGPDGERPAHESDRTGPQGLGLVARPFTVLRGHMPLAMGKIRSDLLKAPSRRLPGIEPSASMHRASFEQDDP